MARYEKNSDKYEIEIKERLLWTIQEASAMSGLGENCIRNIVADDTGHDLHCIVGEKTVKIKAQAFRNFLNDPRCKHI